MSNEQWLNNLELEMNKSQYKEISKVALQMTLLTSVNEDKHEIVFQDNEREARYDITCEMYDKLMNDIGLLVASLHISKKLEEESMKQENTDDSLSD